MDNNHLVDLESVNIYMYLLLRHFLHCLFLNFLVIVSILFVIFSEYTFADTISTVLNDGQGDFDPWNQHRWANWYENGRIVKRFDIDCCVAFAERSDPWRPTVTGQAAKALFRVIGNQGIVIEGNGVVIDLQRQSHDLGWMYSFIGAQFFWEHVTGAEKGFLFAQKFSPGKTHTVLKNITLKGFNKALKTTNGQSHPLRIENCGFSRNWWGLYFSGSKSVVVSSNVYENAKGGIYNGSGSHDNFILNNKWRDNCFLQFFRKTEKTYADIVLDTSYNNRIEGNKHLKPKKGFHTAISMYRNMGEDGNLREDCPHNNVIKANTVDGYSIGFNVGARMGRSGKNDVSGEGRDYASYNTFIENHFRNCTIGIKINTSGNTIDNNRFHNTTYPVVLHAVFYHLVETTINNQPDVPVSFWSVKSDYIYYSRWFPFQDDRNGGIDASEKIFHVLSEFGQPNFNSSGKALFINNYDLIMDNDRYYPEKYHTLKQLLYEIKQESSLSNSKNCRMNKNFMLNVYLTGPTPVEIVCGDFYTNSPGDEFAVLWDKPVSNISGQDYYSILIFDKQGIEVNRCGRSAKKWKTIAAGDFLSFEGYEIAAVSASDDNGKHPIYIFRRGYRQPHAIVLANNIVPVKALTGGNFDRSDDYDEIAVVFENAATDIIYVKPD